jgi:hypothetical protein
VTPAQVEHAAALAAEFMATNPPDRLWRGAFDRWAIERGLTSEMRRAVVVLLLRRRIFNAVRRHEARTKCRS